MYRAQRNLDSKSTPRSLPVWDRTALKAVRRRPPLAARTSQRYVSSLSEIGEHVGRLIAGFNVQLPDHLNTLTKLLSAYADALTPWARATAQNMLNEVNRADLASWRSVSTEIGTELRHLLFKAPVGDRIRELLEQQVGLIKSIPLDASIRVQKLAAEMATSGERADEIEEMIRRSGEVSASRATMIARTEVARAGTVFTQARCEQAGITHYIWRTAHDRDVRPGHRAMEGKVCEWNDPPAVRENDKIYYHHPGEIWNCRCYAEPIISDDKNTHRAFR